MSDSDLLLKLTGNGNKRLPLGSRSSVPLPVKKRPRSPSMDVRSEELLVARPEPAPSASAPAVVPELRRRSVTWKDFKLNEPVSTTHEFSNIEEIDDDSMGNNVEVEVEVHMEVENGVYLIQDKVCDDWP